MAAVIPAPKLRTRAFLGLAGATALVGVALMARTVAAGGFTVLEAVILALFAPTFAWIVVPFWTAVAGFVLRVLRLDPLTLSRRPLVADDAEGVELTSLTAVVMPVYHEDPDAVAARLAAVARSLQETGWGHRFHIHILSDTRDPDLARAEEAAWARLQGTHPDTVFSYRRRLRNDGRKAGNVAEFCDRCGEDYDFMVVLDADSLMTGPTLVRLARTLEACPGVGLIQTVPLPVRQRTLFGRLVQFAACVYGPVLATGLSFWQGDAANYWGHNAMIRLGAFARHARLPVLSGRPPLGGEILSHDFVEAAFLRRAGWKTLLDPRPEGSWEEVPGTVVDYARRDRRWAQGSLQHLRLLALPGLAPLSRLHFLLGAMGYLSSALWFLLLVAGTAYVLLPEMGGTLLHTSPATPAGVSLLALTAVILFLPKALGLLLAMARPEGAGSGRTRLAVGALAETAFSVLLAPVMMVFHTRAVVAVVAGRAVPWDAQPREGEVLSWTAALRAAAPTTLLGLVWGGATLAVSPPFFAWMSPIFAGLLLSAPLVRWSSDPALGRSALGAGLFVTPFEARPPAEVAAVDAVLDGGPPADPAPGIGVSVPPSEPVSDLLDPQYPRMHNAERGLFDLRRGRPLLLRDDTSGPASAGSDVLVAAVEVMTPASLRRLRDLTGAGPSLVVTPHRAAAMGLAPSDWAGPAFVLPLDGDVSVEGLFQLGAGPVLPDDAAPRALRHAGPAEAAGLALAHLGRLLPLVVAAPVDRSPPAALTETLERGEILEAGVGEVRAFVEAAGAGVERVSEAPVPLAQSENSHFILFRESYGLAEHVAILVGAPDAWPDPVPVRLHSACLTGDLFGSLRCDCGEQLRGSLEVFEARGGGVLLYLAQEGRGIGLGNKFRAYTLQESGLDTIDADGTLGFGADERRYDIAARILEEIGVRRIELLTNNPEKVRAMEEAGLAVVRRSPLHGRLNRHNLPYVRAKVQRAGHWLGSMLSQPIGGD